MKRTILTAALAIATLTAAAQTQVIAHRGFHATEGSAHNTISSLRNAQKLGIYGSECDVNMTSDDSLVVVHGKWHRGRKDPQRVHVQKDDFKTVRSRSCENGNIVPTLHEYLEQMKADGKMRLVIEIKNHDTPEREKQVTKAIIDQVKAAGLENQVDYIAFSAVVCDEVTRLAPHNEIAYLNGDYAPAVVKERGYTGIDYSKKVFREHPEWIAEAQKLGLKVNVWTVNEPEDIQYFIDKKVDFITTDNPLKVIEMLKQADKGGKNGKKHNQKTR